MEQNGDCFMYHFFFFFQLSFFLLIKIQRVTFKINSTSKKFIFVFPITIRL
jgi:hypothetical protein